VFINKNNVVPYIKTIGDNKFKQFLTQKFSINYLYTVLIDDNNNVIFHGWRGKNMCNLFKFKNEDNCVLEFYSNEYIIKSPNTTEKHTLSIPITINDFINDMNKYNIPLYWSRWIDMNYEPKQYMDADEICNYFKDLLTKMKKSHELL